MTELTIDELKLAQIMRDAANVLRNDGWTQGDYHTPGIGYCAYGAIYKACGLDWSDANCTGDQQAEFIANAVGGYFTENRDRFVGDDRDDIWSLIDFNDEYATSAEDVIAWFETEAAAIEAAANVDA